MFQLPFVASVRKLLLDSKANRSFIFFPSGLFGLNVHHCWPLTLRAPVPQSSPVSGQIFCSTRQQELNPELVHCAFSVFTRPSYFCSPQRYLKTIDEHRHRQMRLSSRRSILARKNVVFTSVLLGWGILPTSVARINGGSFYFSLLSEATQIHIHKWLPGFFSCTLVWFLFCSQTAEITSGDKRRKAALQHLPTQSSSRPAHPSVYFFFPSRISGREHSSSLDAYRRRSR